MKYKKRKLVNITEKANVIGGVILSYVALGVSLSASLFVTPVILNSVGDRAYGLLSFSNSITAWLSILSSSLGAAYVFFATEESLREGSEKKTNTIFIKLMHIICRMILFVMIIFGLYVRFFDFSFSNYTQEDNHLIMILLFISTTNVIVSVLFSVFGLFIEYKKSFVYSRSINILVSICAYIANLILAIHTKSIIAIAIISVSSSFLCGSLYYVYSIKAKNMVFEKIPTEVFKNEANPIIRYTSVILLGTVISNLDSNLDKTLLGLFIGAEPVTLYQLAVLYASNLMAVAYSFIAVMRPTIFSYFQNGEEEKANKLFDKISRIQCLVVFFIVGGYISCGYHFVELWIGAGRRQVFFYSAVLFISLVIPCTKTFDTEAYRAKNMHTIPTIISILSIVLNVSLSIMLLFTLKKEYAVWACITGTVISRIVFSWIITPIVNYIKLGLNMYNYFMVLIKYLLISIIAVAPSLVVAYLLNTKSYALVMKVLIEGGMFVILYCIGTIVYERKTIFNVVNMVIKKSN